MRFKESASLELKESLQLRDEIGMAVSAFANSGKGKVLVGITDRGEVVGLQLGKKTLHDLANFIKQNTDPSIYPDIIIKKMGSKEVIEITVIESSEKPVFFKGRAYKRVGNTTQRISVSEIKSLIKVSEQIFWDSKICRKAALKDLDSTFIRKYFLPLYKRISRRKITGQVQNVLAHLGCIAKGKPTNAGILLFGKNPQKIFINSYIALARYKGNTIGIERLDYKEFEGSLFKQIDDCEGYIKDHMAMMSKQYPYRARREDIPEYGLFSIRELITNAICHRDYENQHTKIIIKIFTDRIEFSNPGGLLNNITPKNIIKEQFSRNPVISKVLSKVGYIEELGEGWDKIIKEHKSHILKPKLPEIDADKSSIIVTLFSTRDKFEQKKFDEVDLNERQRKAWEYILENGKITNKAYRLLFPGITDRTVLNDLKDMVKKGILIKSGKTKSVVYGIPK